MRIPVKKKKRVRIGRRKAKKSAKKKEKTVKKKTRFMCAKFTDSKQLLAWLILPIIHIPV